MKAKEVMQLLNISRRTLSRYVTEGKIKYTVKHNGQYNYDDESVYALLDDNEVLFQITRQDYNRMMEHLINASCLSKGKYSLLDCANDFLEMNECDFYDEVTLRLLIRLHNYGEINLNEHYSFVEKADA